MLVSKALMVYRTHENHDTTLPRLVDSMCSQDMVKRGQRSLSTTIETVRGDVVWSSTLV